MGSSRNSETTFKLPRAGMCLIALAVVLSGVGCGADGDGGPSPEQSAIDRTCAEKNSDACHACCIDAFPDAWATYQTEYAWPCLCKPGRCDTACLASACAEPAVSPDEANDETCNACQRASLDMGGACMAASVECLKDVGCKPALDCLMGCP